VAYGEDYDASAALAEAQRQAAMVEEIQKDVDATETIGQSAHGMIRVTVRGTGLVTNVTIDEEAVKYYDAETLGGLVLDALNEGMRSAVMSARDKFSIALPDVSLFDDLLARWPERSGSGPVSTPSASKDDWQGW
jgi:nucleoid-associated protein EbfC